MEKALMTLPQTKNTEGQRKPYVDLIQRWAEHEGMEDEGLTAVRRVMNTTQIDAQHMPKEFYQTYRQGEKAEQLIKLIRKIDTKILSGEVVWTWPHVMRVMIDEAILMANVTVNRYARMATTTLYKTVTTRIACGCRTAASIPCRPLTVRYAIR